MTTTDFTTTLLVDQTPKEVFDAISNVRGWWSEEIEGSTDKLNDEFKYHYDDVHRSQIKLIEVVRDQKVVWLVKENYFKFTEDTSEWTGTKISFEISKKDSKTQIRFTHLGLVPEYECFDICSKAWTHYIQQSLPRLIATGKGLPNGKGKPSTDHERNSTLLSPVTRLSRLPDKNCDLKNGASFLEPGKIISLVSRCFKAH